MNESVFIHVVTYNSSRYIGRCIESLRTQGAFEHECTLSITDNNSTDETLSILQSSGIEGANLVKNPVNIGFCGGHNQGAKRFLESECGYFLILNPDIRLEPSAIQELRDALKADLRCGSATPKLFRANEELIPVEPRSIDAAGMELTASLRHFDRGSNEPDTFHTQEYVFGGTGACVMFTRTAVTSLLLEGRDHDSAKLTVHPELSYRPEERAPLFDEAFFAYREDADLAWRAQLLGFACVFVPRAVGYHKRVVLSTNRSELSPLLNGYSVRNRFLLQLNNYFFNNSLASLFGGMFIRNLIVLFGTLLYERSSVPYIKQLSVLYARGCERRRILRNKITVLPHII